MQSANFIATPFYICRALNASNRDQAVSLLRKCQKCGSTKTYVDVLLRPAGHCYQIIFECFSCQLRLDIFEGDLYSPEDYCIDAAPPVSEDTDMRPSNGNGTSNGSGKKIQICLGAKKNADAQSAPSEDNKKRLNLNRNNTSTLTKLTMKPKAFFGDDEDDNPTTSDHAARIANGSGSSNGTNGVPTEPFIIDADAARLASAKVRETMEREERHMEELQRKKRHLIRMRTKMGLHKAIRDSRLKPIVDDLMRRGKRRFVDDLPHLLSTFRDPTKRFGYDIDKIVDYAEASMIRESRLATPPPVPADPIELELASFWQYKERVAYAQELRENLTEAFEEDDKEMHDLDLRRIPVPLQTISFSL